MRVFPVLELPLLTSPYCSLKTRCCGYTTKQAAAEWGDDRLAFFLHPACSSAAHSADQVGELLLIWEKNKKA